MIRKAKIGKNSSGWYVAIPKWYGTWNVLEGLPSYEAAVELLEQYHGLTR